VSDGDDNDRREKQYRRLGTRNPACVVCGDSDPDCLELHHAAGRKHDDDVVIVCRNHHRKLSAQQRRHVPRGVPESSGELASTGHYLLGLSDLFMMIASGLRKYGALLVERARNGGG
jgi:hypothetical protein